MKKLLSVASILLLVGAGCAAQPAPAPAPQPEPAPVTQPTPVPSQPTTSAMPAPGMPPVPEMEVVADLSAAVSITAGGTFSPATLTVKKGSTVTWTNSGGAKVWIASDPHPIHNAYPGFDSGTDLGAGESYAFTFEKAGSWSYHNHFNPTVKGTVIVE